MKKTKTFKQFIKETYSYDYFSDTDKVNEPVSEELVQELEKLEKEAELEVFFSYTKEFQWQVDTDDDNIGNIESNIESKEAAYKTGIAFLEGLIESRNN